MITQKFLESLSYRVIGCIYEVYNHLGPGLLESVYQTCLLDELRSSDLIATEFPYVPITYKNKNLGGKFQPDILIENELIVELKAVEAMIPLYEAQLMTYLKLSGKFKGLLVNFNTDKIDEQIHSRVTKEFFKLPIR